MKIRIISVMMALLMVMSMLFTGCGEEEPYAYELYDSFGTINGESIDYRFVYFATRCEQASIESYYYDSYGPEMWTEEMQNGETMEESVKQTIVDDLENMLVLELYAEEAGVVVTDKEKAAITEAAERFMAENSEEAIAKMGATKEIVERYLTLYTISNKMYESIVAQADTEFELDEYKRTTVSYILLDKEKYALKEAETILEQCKTEYDTLTDEEKGTYEAKEVTYGTTGSLDANLSADVLKVLEGMESDTVCSQLFILEDSYMIVKMVEEFDTEASATAKETLIANAEQDKYEEVLKKYKENVTYEVNEEAWAALTFDIHFELTSGE